MISVKNSSSSELQCTLYSLNKVAGQKTLLYIVNVALDLLQRISTKQSTIFSMQTGRLFKCRNRKEPEILLLLFFYNVVYVYVIVRVLAFTMITSAIIDKFLSYSYHEDLFQFEIVVCCCFQTAFSEAFKRILHKWNSVAFLKTVFQYLDRYVRIPSHVLKADW